MENLFKKQSAKFNLNRLSFTEVMVKTFLVCFFMPHSVVMVLLLLLRTVLFIILLSCLRNDIVILDRLIVFTYLHRNAASYRRNWSSQRTDDNRTNALEGVLSRRIILGVIVRRGLLVEVSLRRFVVQGSGLSYLLFAVIMEVISREFRVDLPWELLYADGISGQRGRGD